MNKWDDRFLDVAKLVSAWSKDTEHKVGAVIVNQDRRIIALGYNGPPSGIDYETKGKTNVLHAEINALLNCTLLPKDCTIYVWPFIPCIHCASTLAQAGIKRVVFTLSEISQKWQPEESLAIFKTLDIEVSHKVPKNS